MSRGTSITSIAALVATTAIVLVGSGPAAQVQAAGPELTVEPLTWDIIGLDSNKVTDGPNVFPLGQRVCNVGDAVASGTSATLVWDSENSYIDTLPGSDSTVVLGDVAAGECAEAYFNIEVQRDAAAYDTVRRYHVEAVSGDVSAESPQPREFYVEYLVSQNRNSTIAISLDGAVIPAGGVRNVVVGGTYEIVLDATTSTNGYNQLETYLSMNNTIFRILSVETTYAADTSPFVGDPNDRLYADGCGWDPDPTSPNYRSCVGGDGKTGGDLLVTYTVQIIGGDGTIVPLNPMLYDFSGSSYHYNSDYEPSKVFLKIGAPADVPFSKSFNPKSIQPGDTSTLEFVIENPTSSALGGVNFIDELPTGMTVADPPNAATTGCGAGTFTTPVGGDTTLTFGGATIAGGGTCVASIDVTVDDDGVYDNVSGSLFINGTTDTGKVATDTLDARTPSVCTPGVTLANWTVPSGASNPPDKPGGFPTVQNGLVGTAVAVLNLPGSSALNTTTGSGDSTSWEVYGYKSAGQYAQFEVDTSNFSDVEFSLAVRNADGAGPSTFDIQYSVDGTNFTVAQAGIATSSAWATATVDLSSIANPSGSTWVRIVSTTANNDQSGAELSIDDIEFVGCGDAPPPPLVSKAFGASPIAVGETTTLTFTVSNTEAGSGELTGLALTDELPAGVVVADPPNADVTGCPAGSFSPSPAADDASVGFTGGSVAAGGTCVFSIDVVGAVAGSWDNVSGFLSATEIGTTDKFATDTIEVVAPPVLLKSFAPTSLLVGDSSTLTFSIDNPNDFLALTGVQFTDNLPAGMSAVNASESACGGTVSVVSNVITLTGATIGAGGSCTFPVTVTGTSVGSLVNTTSEVATNESAPGDPSTATLVVSDPVVAIDITKQVGTTVNGPWTKVAAVAPDAEVWYRFSVYNSGEVPIENVALSDPTLVDAGVVLADCDLSPASPLAVGDTRTCVLGPVSVPAGSNPNTATVSGNRSGQPPITSSPSTATANTTGLTIEKSADPMQFVAADEVISYEYVVTNSGFAALLGPVTVEDDKTTVTCPEVATVGDFDNYLDPAESVTCTATYTVVAGDVTAGSVTNVATAEVDGVTSDPDTVTVQQTNSAISLVKSADVADYDTVGDVIVYTFEIENTGLTGLSDVSLEDPLAGLSDITCEPALAELVLEPGDTVTCTAEYTISQADLDAGEVANSAAVTAVDPGQEQVTDDDQTTVPAIQNPLIGLVKSAELDGDTIAYTYVVSNLGNVSLFDVTVSESAEDFSGSGALPTPEKASGGSDLDDDQIADDLAPGSSMTFTASYEVTTADRSAGVVENQAMAAADDPSGEPVEDRSDDSLPGPDDNDPTEVVVPGTPKIAFTKSVALPLGVSAATVGTVLTYTLTATNVGTVPVSGVMIDDPMAGLSALSCQRVQPTVLNPGEALICTATYTVTASDVAAGSILNLATVIAYGPDDNPVSTADDLNESAQSYVPVVTGQLPVTGGSTQRLLLAALALLAVGSLMAGRRRRNV
jgi:uncharacterized repeat protein (TIGR01451 family)